ncbi:hypothetical protein ACXYMU_19210 [Pontibacter sp. CAU 1760]
MILFQNSLIKLDYNPGKDILCVNYPDLHDYLLSEIKHSIGIIIDTVRNYDIKFLLLDGRQTISTTPTQEGRDIALTLATGLAQTRLRKLARLESQNPDVEQRAKENVAAVHTALAPPFDIKNFSEEQEALTWLAAGEGLSERVSV